MSPDPTISRCLKAVIRALALVVAVTCGRLAAAEIDLSKIPPPAPARVEFARDIQPLLAENCHRCHGAEKQESGLRLDLKAAALKGGDSGAVIIPNKGIESRLIHLVAGAEEGLVMPRKGGRLTAEQVGRLRAWIDQGAEWPTAFAEPKAKDKADWWAFKPAQRPPVPLLQPGSTSTNPIDAFIRARLAESKLEPSPEADRITLIRRVSYDLIGLPPTPGEVDEFLSDQSPAAYEKVVDRLLASPRHGERWARHWLDAVHYGETHGYDKDKLRLHAWPYRDYVIRAFNDDKPYSRFIEEQLAGDVLYPDEPDGIVALGFIAAAIGSGRLGEIVDMEVHINISTPWQIFPFLKAMERVEIAVHSIHYLDLFRSIAGDPQGVFARSIGDPRVPDLAQTRSSIILDYGQRLRALLSINHNHDFGRDFQTATIRFEGTKGCALVKLGLLLDYPHGEPDELWLCEAGHGWEQIELQGQWFPDAFANVMSNLQRFHAGDDAELLTCVDDAFLTMQLVESCFTANRTPPVAMEP
jgi:mono/diheme cytochrome c family protein